MTLGNDRGQVGGAEVLPFGLLVFVVGALLVANAWAVIDAKFAVTTASREAVRAYVEASDGDDATRAAHEAATAALTGHGREPSRAGVVITPERGTRFGRCTAVRIEVTYAVPAIPLPFIGGYGRGFEVRASHREVVDPYRDGVPGEVSC